MDRRVNSDGVLHDALRKTYVEFESEEVKLHGKLPRQVDAEQEAKRQKFEKEKAPMHATLKALGTANYDELTVGTVVTDVVKTVELAMTEVPKAAAQAAYATLANVARAIWEKDDIHASHVRAAAYGATMLLCEDLLPEGFSRATIPALWDKYAGKPGNPDEMTRGAYLVADHLRKNPESKAALFNECREGQLSILRRGARHPDEVNFLFARDPALKRRYEQDTAFRLGVDSARWALENGRADELRSNLGILERPPIPNLACRESFICG